MSRAASFEAAGLARLRAASRERFEALGIPKPTDEDWRQTDVRAVAPFAATSAPPASVAASQLDAFPLVSALPCRAVLVNGRYDEALSTPAAAPRGVKVQGLAAALEEAPDALDRTLARTALGEQAPFVALNTAMFADGVLVSVAAKSELDVPLHVVHVAVPGSAPAAVHPRTLLIAEAGSRVTLVETFVTVGSGAYLTNAVTELVAEAGAHVEHVKIQDEAALGWHIAAVAGRQARDARIVSHNFSLGAALARNDIGSRLEGPGAECRLYGLYAATGSQHVDNHTWLDHATPHGASWEMYKGLLGGTARAIFNGRIIVREGAQKTDAKQSNKNLILGDGALVYTRPQLEIYANDVKCTHGATIGRLDEEALFYLRTRGLAKAAAKRVLIRAFADDLIDNLPAAPVRSVLSEALHHRLESDFSRIEARA